MPACRHSSAPSVLYGLHFTRFSDNNRRLDRRIRRLQPQQQTTTTTAAAAAHRVAPLSDAPRPHQYLARKQEP
jgi:hypothetical protein